MNTDHLRLFARIAATQNITQAGKELGLSAAVASLHIQKLEKELGVRLVHRTTRQVSLTEDGLALLPHAKQILDNLESARMAISSNTISPSGKLRITASATFGRMHILPAMREFLSRHPKLEIELHLSDTIADIVAGGFDIAIRDAALNDSSLIARKLAPVTRILCAAPNYLAQYGEPQTPADLLQHQCVNLMGLETWHFDTDTGPVSIKTQNTLRTDNGEAARDASVMGLGIHCCSTWCCYQQLQRGELVQVLADFPLRSHTDLWAVYPSSQLLSPKVRLFIDHLVEQFGPIPYWDAEQPIAIGKHQNNTNL